MVRVDRALARKVLEIVDKGLVMGMGDPEPGQMCVEAAVCYAMGLRHSDEPPCVSAPVRVLKIAINDANVWNSDKSRAKGLRRLAIAQLGSKGKVHASKFVAEVRFLMLSKIFPDILKQIQKQLDNKKLTAQLELLFKACEKNDKVSFKKAVRELYSRFWEEDSALSYGETAQTVLYSMRDIIDNDDTNIDFNCIFSVYKNSEKEFMKFCEDVVQILVRLKSPGARWLDLTQ